MSKIDQLIAVFKEVKEDLNKNVNNSYAGAPNATTGTSGGQGGMYRSEGMEKQMPGASPGGAQDMQMIKYDKNGQWRMDKYDHEKGMPANPIARPKPSMKPMGANQKPVLASRHKTQKPAEMSPGDKRKVFSDPDVRHINAEEHTLHEPDTKKAEECHTDDPHHEAKEKKIAKDIKAKANKLEGMHKASYDGSTGPKPYDHKPDEGVDPATHHANRLAFHKASSNNPANPKAASEHAAWAKWHQNKLSLLRSVKKSQLSELADDIIEKLEKRLKGVHEAHSQVLDYEGGKAKGGQSNAGFSTRMSRQYGDKQANRDAHRDHRVVLSDIRRMKKPNLTKEDDNYISQDGKNREANPKLRESDLGPGGKVHMIKDETRGVNEEETGPHNKGKFKVMPMAPEKSEKHAAATGKPYNGDDKDVKKEDMEKDAADPKLAPKDKKVKALQQQIDAGTYKPDPKKIASAMVAPLKKSEEFDNLEKGHPPYKVREVATRLAGRGPVLARHKAEATRHLDAEAAKKPKVAAAPKADHSKMEVSHISSYSAPGQGHEYQVTHHYRDGRTSSESKPQKRVNARVRNPAQTHTIHLKGHAEPIHTDEATAHAALKAGHFNMKAHLDKA